MSAHYLSSKFDRYLVELNDLNIYSFKQNQLGY